MFEKEEKRLSEIHNTNTNISGILYVLGNNIIRNLYIFYIHIFIY